MPARGAKLGRILEELAKVQGKEGARNPGTKALDHLVYGVMAGASPQRAARKAFESLQGAFVDWNELRVAEPREILEHLTGLGDREDLRGRAELLRRTLQAPFDARDTVRIEMETPEDEQEVMRALGTVPGLPAGLVAAVVARDRPEPPVRLLPGISRMAQRLGVIPRTGGEVKQAAALAAAAGPGEARVLMHFLLAGHAETVCVPNRPACETCPVVELCDHGKKNAGKK